MAYVPEYDALRTFAVERIQSLSLTEERFEPVDLPADAFENSLGVNQGTPERIEIVFEPRIARYIKERVWHPSQQIDEAADGRADDDAERLQRFRAAQLDSGIRPACAGQFAAGAGAADSGRGGTRRG